MGRIRVVGGAAVGADVGASGNETGTIAQQAAAGDTAAGWALRWFLLSVAFLVFFGIMAVRR
jgi:hypothetical protein